MRIFRDLIIIVLVFVLAWWLFTSFSDTTKKQEIISVKKEVELAEYLKEFIFKRYDSISTDYTDSVMQIIKNRLLKTIDSSNYDIKFHIIKSGEVNAFTSLGGNIYIFSGLIEKVSGPEELSAVLAHEIAHAEKRHVIKHMIRELGTNAIIMILTGGDQVLMEQLGKMIISSSFSKEFEREADEMALEILQNAKLNPNRLAHFFIKLQEKGDIPEVLTWVSSHPSLKERIERVLKQTEKLEKTEEKLYEVDWEKMLNELNSK